MSNPNHVDSGSFWHYSVAKYDKPNVMASCLTLQDEHGVNVNLLLLLCWCLDYHRLLTLSDWQSLLACVKESDATIQALRVRRRNAKAPDAEEHKHYEVFKAEELLLERQQQQLIINQLNALSNNTIAPNTLNASIASFAAVYTLRHNKTAMQLIANVIHG